MIRSIIATWSNKIGYGTRKGDAMRNKTVPVSGSICVLASVVPARWDDFSFPFPGSWVAQVLEGGQGSICLYCLLQSTFVLFCSFFKPGCDEFLHISLDATENLFFAWLFEDELMLVFHFRSWEMVIPRNFWGVSTVDTGLLDIVRSSSVKGCLVKYTVICLTHVLLQVVDRTQVKVIKSSTNRKTYRHLGWSWWP